MDSGPVAAMADVKDEAMVDVKEDELMPQAVPGLASLPPPLQPLTNKPPPSGTAGHGRSKKRNKRTAASSAAARGGAAAGTTSVAADSDMIRVVRVERPGRGGASSAADAAGDGRVLLSRTDRAAQLTLSDDRLSVSGTKGFRSVRTTHGAAEGAWYCEARVTHLGPTGHVRLGWATDKAELQASAGCDKWGYTYRDLEGSKVHNGRREPYGAPYGEGDVVGMYAHLPPSPREPAARSIVLYKGAMYHAVPEEAEPEAPPLPGAALAFVLNGALQGVAFADVYEGTYFAAASLFTLPGQAEGAAVTFNFGPDFAFPPPAVDGCPAPRPLCELVAAAAEAAAAAAAAEAAAAVADRAQSGGEVPGTAASFKVELVAPALPWGEAAAAAAAAATAGLAGAEPAASSAFLPLLKPEL